MLVGMEDPITSLLAKMNSKLHSKPCEDMKNDFPILMTRLADFLAR